MRTLNIDTLNITPSALDAITGNRPENLSSFSPRSPITTQLISLSISEREGLNFPCGLKPPTNFKRVLMIAHFVREVGELFIPNLHSVDAGALSNYVVYVKGYVFKIILNTKKDMISISEVRFQNTKFKPIQALEYLEEYKNAIEELSEQINRANASYCEALNNY